MNANVPVTDRAGFRGSDPASTSSSPGDLEVTFAFMRRVGRFHRSALALFLVGVAATLAFDGMRDRKYRSETVLRRREVVRFESNGGESGNERTRRLGVRLKDSLLSRARLAPIIVELKLYPRQSGVDAEEQMRKNIAFRTSGDTFMVSFDATRPAMAQAGLARLAADLIDENVRVESEQQALAHAFLQTEIADNDAKLKTLEATAGQFMSRHPEFSRGGALATSLLPPPTPPQTDNLLDSRRGDDGAAYLALQVEAAQRGPLATQQELHMARRHAAEGNEQAARQNLSEKLALYTERHPDVIAARQTDREAKALLERARADVEASAPQALHERFAAVAKLGGRASSAPSRQRPPTVEAVDPSEETRLIDLETQWVQMNRSIGETRDVRALLAQHLFSLSVAANGMNSHLTVIDPANLPQRPLSPGHREVITAGLVIALLLSLALAIGRALLDDRLYGHGDFVGLDVGPIFAEVPAAAPLELDGPDHCAATASLSTFLRRLEAPPESPQSASFGVLRFHLEAVGDPHVIVVTSAEANEGSMYCAVNLATAIAAQGQVRVVLIDANARERAALSAIDESTEAPGAEAAEAMTLCHAAEGTRMVLHLVKPAPRSQESLDHVRLVSSGRPVPRTHAPLQLLTLPPPVPGESLDGAAVAEVCRHLLENVCDYVVIGAPPVLGSADANILAHAGDGVLIASQSGKSSARSVRRAIRQLAPTRMLGVTLLPASA